MQQDDKLDGDHPHSDLVRDQLTPSPSPRLGETIKSWLEMVFGPKWQGTSLLGVPRRKPTSAQWKSALMFPAGTEIHPRALKGGTLLAVVLVISKHLPASCDSRQSLQGREIIFDVKGKKGFSSSSQLWASACFVQPCKFIVFQIACSQGVSKEMPDSVQFPQLRKAESNLESFFWSNGGRFSTATEPRGKS